MGGQLCRGVCPRRHRRADRHRDVGCAGLRQRVRGQRRPPTGGKGAGKSCPPPASESCACPRGQLRRRKAAGRFRPAGSGGRSAAVQPQQHAGHRVLPRPAAKRQRAGDLHRFPNRRSPRRCRRRRWRIFRLRHPPAAGGWPPGRRPVPHGSGHAGRLCGRGSRRPRPGVCIRL